MKKRAPNPRQVTPIPAVEDYPRNQAELDARFGSAEACGAYLIQVRWPDGFQRPTCSHRKGWPVCGLFLQCAACRRRTTVAAGTIFQDTRTPLTTSSSTRSST